VTSLPPKSEALQGLYWRAEILRVIYWMRGEGLGDIVDAPLLEHYLGPEASTGLTHLDELVEEGYLVRDGSWYWLSERGRRAGEEHLATAFSDLVRPVHGPCSDECWCQTSPVEAETCERQRRKRQPK
jgi:hypothetical protein